MAGLLAVLTMAGTVPANAAGSAPTGAAPSDTATALAAPYSRTLFADYQFTDPEAAVIHVSTAASMLRIEFPPQFAQLGISSLEFYLNGSSIETSQLDVAPGATVAEAPFRLARPGTVYAPRLDANGQPYGTGDTSTTSVLSLDSSNASSFDYQRTYWSEPSTPLWLTPGSAASVVVPAIGGSTEVTSVLGANYGWTQDGPVLAATASAAAPDQSVAVAVTAPLDLDTDHYMNNDQVSWADGSTVLTTTVRNGPNSVVLRTRVTVAAETDRGIDVNRIYGYNRFAGGYAIASALVRPTPDTVYLASGETFGDALSIAPLAALERRPIALGTSDAWSMNEAITLADGVIGNARARRVVQIGGEKSLPPLWRWHLQDDWQGPHVLTDAIAGADRYEVSRNIAAYGYAASGAPTVFVATGRSFADALSAVPAAASQKSPVILVDGSAAQLDEPTRNLLALLGARKAVIVGGRASVSTAIEGQLTAMLSSGSVTRFGGADRYAVSQAINAAYFPNAQTAYLASGEVFADALTGGVLAGANHAPLLLARPDCVPGAALDSLAAWHTARVTVLGGPYTLVPSVVQLTRCP